MNQKMADATAQHMMMPCQLSATFCCNTAQADAAMAALDRRRQGCLPNCDMICSTAGERLALCARAKHSSEQTRAATSSDHCDHVGS